MSDKGKIRLVNHVLTSGPMRCPNCTRELETYSGQCRRCGTVFRDSRHTLSRAEKVYNKPRFRSMSREEIKEFAEDADSAWHTEGYEICYAKRGKAIRFHVEVLAALRRCVQIILRPFTDTT